eukprot:gene24290-35086_t
MPCVSGILACIGAVAVLASSVAAVDLDMDGLLLPFIAGNANITAETTESPALAALFTAGFGCDTLATAQCNVNLATPGINTVACCEWENSALAPICPGKAHCGHVPDADCNFEEQANTIFGIALQKRCRDLALLEAVTTLPTTTTATKIVSPSCAPGADDIFAASCGNDYFSRVPPGGVYRDIDGNIKHTDKSMRCTCNFECVSKYGDCCYDYDTKCLTSSTTTTTTSTIAKPPSTGSCKMAGGGNVCGNPHAIELSPGIGQYCLCGPDCIFEDPLRIGAKNACCDDFGATCVDEVQQALLECPSAEISGELAEWNPYIGCLAYSHSGQDFSSPSWAVAYALCPGSYGVECSTSTTTTATTTTSTTTTATTTTETTTTETTTT